MDQAQYDYDNTLIPSENKTPGLKVDIYNQLTSMYPNMSSTDYNFCKTITLDDINKDWGGGDIEGCGSEFIMLHYTGYLTVPETTSYSFLNIADDGWFFKLGNTVVNNDWTLKGCSGNWSQQITLEANRSYEIDAWFYEWGGGACSTLYYQTTSNWGVVPYTWYSQNALTNDPGAKDPLLLEALTLATNEYNAKLLEQSEKYSTIDVLQQSILDAEQEVDVAQSELEAIPPFRELPPTPTPSTEPTQEPEEAQPEPLPTPEQTEPTVQPEQNEPQDAVVEQAQEQLEERAEANDIGVLPYTLADAVTEIQAEETLAVLTDPSAMATALSEGVSETIAFVGELFTDPSKTITKVLDNVSQAGLDMSEDQREKAQEVIVPVVIVSQIASMMVGRIK